MDPNHHSNSPKTWNEKRNENAIAIIGFAVDLPSADSIESFWKTTEEGRCTAQDFPASRINHTAWHDADGLVPGTVRPKRGHFLGTDITAFDAPFFSITETETAAMDPQQRRLLEVTYRALENAGIPMEKISGTKTAVFTGNFTSDYLLLNARDPEQVPKYASTGLSGAFLSNRLSNFFNLVGPSMTIDTACSSSLIAFDQACRSVSQGEASMGIVTGCNLIFALDTTLGLSRMGFLSPDGICHSFDSRANGYSRGEGFAAIIIKPVLRAIQDGDTIRAIVRATKSNQNGSTALAQPSKESQVSLIRDTYLEAGLSLSRTQYVEAHGTGTATGDPIEATALGETFGYSQANGSSVYIGTAKANFGHTEGASGITGIIKAALVIEKGIIPPIANFETLNHEIDADFFNLKFPNTCHSWPGNDIRRASVCSSGFGGANAHAVLEDAYHYLQDHGLLGNHCVAQPHHQTVASLKSDKLLDATPARCHPQLFIWSAADPHALQKLLSLYGDYITQAYAQENHQQEYLNSLAYTLCERRSLLPWVAYVVADSLPALSVALKSKPLPQRVPTRQNIGFVFTGQGAQWLGMGCELLQYDVFRQSVEQADIYLQTLGCRWGSTNACNVAEMAHDDLGSQPSLLDIFNTTESTIDINNPRIAQPMCTVLQVGLVDTLRSFNISPALTVGHSSGEIAAAYASGAISREAAWRLAYFRGVLCAQLTEQAKRAPGGMIAVNLSEIQAQSYIDQIVPDSETGNLCVACYNSPSSVTISGDRAFIEQLQDLLERDHVFHRTLPVTVAYHSPQMQDITCAYIASIGSIEPGDQSTMIPMISSVTGSPISRQMQQSPRYWADNLVSPVKFASAIHYCFHEVRVPSSKKLDLSHRNAVTPSQLLEIGPHSSLQSPILETLRSMPNAPTVHYASCLVRHQSAIPTLMHVAGHLHSPKSPVNVSNVNAIVDSHRHQLRLLSSLPAYPFNHSKSYWNESRISKSLRLREYGYHALLGTPVADWNDAEPRWRHFLNASTSSSTAWIRDHKINGDILFPAAGMLVMALEAVIRITAHTNQKWSSFEWRNVEFLAGLTVSENDDTVEVGIRLIDIDRLPNRLDKGFEFAVYAYHEKGVTHVCRGAIQPILNAQLDTKSDTIRHSQGTARIAKSEMEEVLSRSMNKSSGVALYKRLYQLGYQFGGSFRRIELVQWEDSGEAIGEISVFDDPSRVSTIIHPATLDAVIQGMLAASTRAGNEKLPIMIPTRIDRLRIEANPILLAATTRLQILSTRQSASARTQEFNCSAFDDTGCLMILFNNIQATTISANDDAHSAQSARQLCFDMVYEPDISFLGTDQIQDIINARRPVAPEPEVWHEIQSFVFALMKRIAQQLDRQEIPSQPPHLRKQFDWITQNSKHTGASIPSTSDKEFGHRGPIQRIYQMFATRLQDILLGKLSATEFLSQENILREYYDFHNSTAKFFGPLERFLQLLSHKNPALRVIEVGAGTGSTTKYVLDMLTSRTSYGYCPRYSRFDFTDISAYFLNDARDTFSQHPNMHFGVFDVEKEAAVQGYDEQSYDVVVAANVLHATKCLDNTLRSLRTLLKRDGTLILIEITEYDKVAAPIIFGCLPGWWLSEDSRCSGPCLSKEQWDRTLKTCGFSGTDIVLRDYDSDIHFVSCMISTAVLPCSATTPSLGVPTRIVTGFDSTEVEETPLVRLVREVCACHEFGNVYEAVSDPLLPEQLVVLVVHDRWPRLGCLTDKEYGALKSILIKARAILCISETTSSNGDPPHDATLLGLARTLRLERTGLVFVTISVDMARECASKLVTQAIENTMKGIETGVYEPELAQSNTVLEISRVYEDDSLNQRVHAITSSTSQNVDFNSRDLELRVKSPGLLDTLYFIEQARDFTPLGADEVEIEVKAIGVNFRDLLLALGTVQADTFGSECSGVVHRAGPECSLQEGDRVVVGYSDPFCRTIRCKEFMALAIPDEMSFNEAASIPINFMTAYRALIDLANVTEGETVLIHAGAGGTGQAAIQIALLRKATVYVTVGNSAKKQLIMDRYGIPEDHILHSRDTSFANAVMRLTNGRGVDVVLNSLAGPGLLASWESIAPYGRFMEIGKKDIASRRDLPMSHFSRNVSFMAVDIAAMSKERPRMLSNMLATILKLFATGALRSVVPLTAFPISQTEEALRYLQTGTNAGKAVVEVNPCAQVPAIVRHTPTWKLDPNGTYVIAGGLGGLGRSVVRWMLAKGGRHFLLLSRTGLKTGSARSFVANLESAGIRVLAQPCDISNSDALQQVLRICAKTMPSIKGCIQSTMVMRDTAFEKMSAQQWRESLGPKVAGSWNLHKQLPRGLDFFVLFSSATGIVGSQSQANYAAGNTFQDSLARMRRAEGEAGTSIDICVMQTIGVLAEHRDVSDQIINVKHIMPMSECELLALLEEHCSERYPRRCQIVTGLTLPATVHARESQEAAWMSQPMFSPLHQTPDPSLSAKQTRNSNNVPESEGHVFDALVLAINSNAPVESVALELTAALQYKISKFLSLNLSDLDVTKPLHTYGIDSLIGMELRSWIFTSLKVEMSVFEILGGESAKSLAGLIIEKMQGSDVK
ncbi:putative polyketide synthase [Xylariaceae sp. FL1272]|nr:putative polyketide synthase [Xylariaceae sp. FL1272]